MKVPSDALYKFFGLSLGILFKKEAPNTPNSFRKLELLTDQETLVNQPPTPPLFFLRVHSSALIIFTLSWPDPSFVHVHLIPDSAEKNDDKLYFFFREKSLEMGQSPKSEARIGRICLVSQRRL